MKKFLLFLLIVLGSPVLADYDFGKISQAYRDLEVPKFSYVHDLDPAFSCLFKKAHAEAGKSGLGCPISATMGIVVALCGYGGNIHYHSGAFLLHRR